MRKVVKILVIYLLSMVFIGIIINYFPKRSNNIFSVNNHKWEVKYASLLGEPLPKLYLDDRYIEDLKYSDGIVSIKPYPCNKDYIIAKELIPADLIFTIRSVGDGKIDSILYVVKNASYMDEYFEVKFLDGELKLYRVENNNEIDVSKKFKFRNDSNFLRTQPERFSKLLCLNK